MLNTFLIKKIWLKRDEVPILVIRGSLANWFWSWLLTAVLLLADFFLMFFLWQRIWGIAVFATILLIAFWLLARSYFEYYFTGWVLTNLRVVDFYQQGFWHRETGEILYDKISEVYSHKNGFFGMFNLGDVYISLTGSKVKFKLNLVRDYDRAIAEVLLQQESYQKNLLDSRERKAQFLLTKIKNKLGAKEFNRLVGD